MYSHNPIDEALAQELQQLGPVEHIVAPNKFHNLFLKKTKSLYPHAKLWVAEGLSDRKPGVPFDEELSQGSQPWSPELEMIMVDGSPKYNEVIFFHQKSKTLICADFLFNVQRDDFWFMRLLWRVLGAWKSLKQSRTWRQMVDDKKRSRKSVDKVLEWDVQRIVMAHGDVVEKPGDKLRRAFSWLGVR